MDDTGPGNTEAENDRTGNRSEHLRLASIDHEEYDALADLFLGEGGFAPEPVGLSQDDEILSADEPKVSHATHTPVLHLTRHEDDALIDQPVERVLESLDITESHASELLAELLGERSVGIERDDLGPDARDEVDTIEFVEMPEPTVEVVVLGHLPVRASLWARQYACNQAKALCETVALVRAASGSTSVDLITDGESISVRTFAHLEGALEAVSKLADRVILRVDESSEPELLERAEVEEITILTGADEAAVVASYRLIKTLDATLGEQFVADEGPSLRVAVMGAGREMAMDACTKLGNAVETFIGRAIEIVVGSGRIDATGTTNLYRDSVSHRASDILDGLVAAARETDEPTGLHIAVTESETDTVIEVKAVNVEPLVEFPVGGVLVPEPKAAVETPKREANDDDAPTMRDGLSALIPGLDPIEARCPKALGVDLALDSEGRLHLIVCDADTRDAMNRLLAAQAWARDNLGLLIRAEAGLAAPSSDRDVDTDAVMHLISDEPRSVREIYDTNVRVYSLARVKVGNVIAQVATPIN